MVSLLNKSCFAALVPKHHQQNVCGKNLAISGLFLAISWLKPKRASARQQTTVRKMTICEN